MDCCDFGIREIYCFVSQSFTKDFTELLEVFLKYFAKKLYPFALKIRCFCAIKKRKTFIS